MYEQMSPFCFAMWEKIVLCYLSFFANFNGILLQNKAVSEVVFIFPTPCKNLLDILWGQPIKLVQVAFTSELLENQRNNLVFFKIIPSHFCRASEASKIDYFKN